MSLGKIFDTILDNKYTTKVQRNQLWSMYHIFAVFSRYCHRAIGTHNETKCTLFLEKLTLGNNLVWVHIY